MVDFIIKWLLKFPRYFKESFKNLWITDKCRQNKALWIVAMTIFRALFENKKLLWTKAFFMLLDITFSIIIQ
jgi:hypothetical protein